MKNQLERHIGTNFDTKFACESKKTVKMAYLALFLLPKRLQEAIWELQDSLKGEGLTLTRQQRSEPTLRGDSPLHAGRISLDPGTLVCAGFALGCAESTHLDSSF